MQERGDEKYILPLTTHILGAREGILRMNSLRYHQHLREHGEIRDNWMTFEDLQTLPQAAQLNLIAFGS